MKLKALEISGFKSFADHTMINFHEGITCVVGPNGCGKSNISDALRWVLGEQSVRIMRGHKMPDIIFSGTNQRKALPFAEVSITFNEVNFALPIDYEEVTITRRLKKDGESEYFINRQSVRLKDLQQLFLDSGIGKNNFFEQGKIDQIIYLTPLERRSLFEEVAGINRFLQRKKESLKKLEEVVINRERLKDIISEVEKQIVKLTTQATAATLYKKQKNQLDTLEKNYLITRYCNVKKRYEEIFLKKEAYQVMQKNLEVEISKNEKIAAEVQAELKKLSLKSAQIRENYLIKQGEKELHLHMQKEQEKKQQFSLQKEGQIALETKELKEKLIKLNSEKALIDLEKALRELRKGQEELLSQEKIFQVQEQDLNEKKLKQKQIYQQKIDFLTKENDSDSQLKNYILRLENSQEKKNHLVDRQENLQLLLKEKEQELSVKEQTFQQITANLMQLKKEQLELETEINETSLAFRKVQQLDNEQTDLLKEVTLREKILLDLKKQGEGFSTGTLKLLKLANDPLSTFYQKIKTIYDFIKTPAKDKILISSVLKNYDQALVVESLSTLEALLTYTQEEAINDFSILCLELVEQREEAENQKIVNQIQDLFLTKYFLNNLSTKTTFENFLKEKSSKGKNFWIESEQFLIDPKGVIYKPVLQDRSIFAREDELKQLQITRDKLEENQQLLKKEVAVKKTAQNLAIEKREKLNQVFRQKEMKGVEANFFVQKVISEKLKLTGEFKQLKQEIYILEQNLLSLLEKIEKISLENKILKKDKEQIFKSEEHLEKTIQTLQNHFEQTKTDYKKSQEKLRDQEKLHQNVTQHFHHLTWQIQEVTRSLERLENTSNEQKILKTSVSEQLKKALADSQALKVNLDQLAEENSQLEKQLTEINQQFKQLNAGNESQKLLLKEGIEKGYQLESQLSYCQNQLEDLAKILFNQYALNQEKIIPVALGQSLEKIEKHIKELKQTLENATEINLSSIEELAQTKERGEFLQEQLQDVEESEKMLLELMDELEQKSQEIFLNTFNQIKINFKKNFQVLFQGGDADLELTNSKAILEAGIEIIAKPPGKQMRNLNLLSGGEKCLTTMALLFAFFSVKTAPFCVLDEIDAPLDEVNVERLIQMVKQFTQDCQFIIITHNKTTMTLAERLYGISMEEKGVSKIISLELNTNFKQPFLSQVK